MEVERAAPKPEAPESAMSDVKPAEPGASYDNPEAAKQAERAALNVHAKLNTNALPVRQYLEATVVPLMMQAMQSLARERPEDPVEYVAAYLLKHNPRKSNPGASASAQNPAGQAQQQMDVSS